MKFIILALVVVAVIFLVMRSSNNKKDAEENIAIGNQFLLENKDKENVIQTASGLQYEVLQKGDGDTHPTASSTVKVHYHGTLLDGSVFDSSVDRGEPISFPLNRVIKGWTEGVQLMVVGDKFRFFIPSELAYGNQSAGAIKPGSTLIFEVELLAIE
jgi:peptidylprolyl isomerase